ncbi:hypothetical protein UFOVP395_9 [uncultured Caudovirales phage]|jgi:hypothetical protein|uniref:Uncharacterized protein n=1 Tax=uncultured Caudovirales phage TaxID=2100421 RepID=A0A6J5M0A2_9CAUD|nr:hypothetical protein UFOVP395_9 [uncultured Caudovirales phage]
MELRARIIERTGDDRYVVWLLQDSTGKLYGRMSYSGYRAVYTVEIFSPVHEELGSIACNEFGLRSDGLTWARDQIENLQEPTVADYEAAIRRVKDSRYQDEMSDDFAYSNGKINRWDRIERQLKDRMHGLTPAAI